MERLTGVYNNMTRGIVAMVFRCRLRTEHVPSTDEASAVRWHELTAVPGLMSPAYAVRVADALDGAVHVRAHDGTHLLPRDSSVTTR